MELSYIGNKDCKLMVVVDYINEVDYQAKEFTKDGGLSILTSIVGEVLDEWSMDDVCIVWLNKNPVPQFAKPKKIKNFDLVDFEEQVAAASPSCILALGSRTASYLLKSTLSEAINKVHRLADTPLIFSQSPRGLDDYKILVNAFISAISIIEDPEYDPYEETIIPYTVIEDFDQLMYAVDQCKKTGYCCMDFETDGGDWYNKLSFATMIGFAAQPGHTWIINIEHYATKWSCDDVEKIFHILETELLSNKEVTKIAHNAKYEAHWFIKYGVDKFAGIWHDTMLMSHAYDENTKNDLKSNVDRFLTMFAGYALKPEKGQSWADISFKKLCKYNAIDVHATFVLYFFFKSKLLADKDSRLYIAYRNVRMGAFWMFVRMEHRGALIDTKRVEKSIQYANMRLGRKRLTLLEFSQVAKFVKIKNTELCRDEINKLEEKITKHRQSSRNMSKLIAKYEAKISDLKNGREKLFTEVNFNSVPQLKELLFTHDSGFNLPVNPDTGKPETNKEYLRSLHHRFTDTLLAYRSIKKMVNTYYEGILDKVDSKNRLHTQYNQHGTVTQRLSCSKPNLQNIPTRTAQADEDVIWAIKEVKKFFTVPDGYTAMQADFSQAELRLIANYSGDQTMQRVYLDNKDIHAMTASEIVGMDYESFLKTDKKFYKENRNTAKSANFGLVYDISIPGYIAYIKNSTGGVISDNEAQRHKDSLFRKYPGLIEWHKTYKQKVKKFKYVRTLFGSKRRLPSIDSADNYEKSKAERNAINAPIQGSGGQYTEFTMAMLEMVLPDSAMFFNTVHDSEFLYVRNDLLNYVIPLVIKYTEKIDLSTYFDIDPKKVVIPMKMDFEISGVSWGDMEEIDSEKYR